MKHILFSTIFYCLLFEIATAQQQKNISIGLNVAPIIVGGTEIYAEIPFKQSISFQGGIAARYQNTSPQSEYPIKSFQNYIHLENQGVAIQTGARFADHYAEYYPYAAINIVGSFYRYRYLGDNSLSITTQGVSIGTSASVGFVAQLYTNLYLDVAFQIGGATNIRNSPTNFYLSGMGYNLNGVTESPFLQKMMVQPIIVLKYQIAR